MKKHNTINTSILIALLILVLSSGCTTYDSVKESVSNSIHTIGESTTYRSSDSSAQYYPKVSEDADTVLCLHSNIEKTTFYVDSKKMVTGKRVKILINKTKSYTVVAEPEGYISKEDFIQPPYMNGTLLSFTFLMGEKLDSKPEHKAETASFISDVPVMPEGNNHTDKIREKSLNIAVVEFTKRGSLELPDAGTIVAEWMTAALNKTGAFNVYDRLSMETILSEHELGMSGLLDEKTLAKIGKIHGVQAVVTGSVIKYDDNVSVTAKLIDTETAKIIDTTAVKASSFDALASVMYNLALDLAKE